MLTDILYISLYDAVQEEFGLCSGMIMSTYIVYERPGRRKLQLLTRSEERFICERGRRTCLLVNAMS